MEENNEKNDELEDWEKNTDEYKSHIQSIFYQKKNKYEEEQNSEKLKKVEKAILAFRTALPWEERYKNMEQKPLQEIFDEETLKHYLEKIKNIEVNPILKSRYADVLWETKNNFQYARIAILSYLESSDVYFDKKNYIELFESLERALVLSIKTNNSIDESIKKHYEILEKLDEINEVRWFLEIIESLLNNFDNKRIKDKIDFDTLENLLEKSISFYEKEENINLLLKVQFLVILEKLYRAKKEQDKIELTKIRQAETLIQEAEIKKTLPESGHLAATIFYEQAMRIYVDLTKYPKKVIELQLKIQDAYRFAKQNEGEEISVRKSFDENFFEPFIGAYRNKTLMEIFLLMDRDPDLNQSFENSKKQAEEQLKKFIAHRIMPTVIIRDDIKVSSTKSEEDELERATIENFCFSINFIGTLFLKMLFDVIKDEHENYVNEIVIHLKKSSLIDPIRVDLIQEGLKYFEKSEYIASIHILLFQIEGILRDFFTFLYLPTYQYKMKEEEMRLKLFSKLISELSKKGLDKDFVKLIEFLLCEMTGFNYRNNMAHGLIKDKEEFSEKLALLLIFILIKLSFYEVEFENDEVILKNNNN